MKTTFISISDYNKLKKGKNIIVAVEAKGKPPIGVTIVPGYAIPNPNPDTSNYENAIFNCEHH